MLAFFSILILLHSVYGQNVAENSINLKTNFHIPRSVCNIYDESHYCQQIVIDKRMELVAVSHKCSCPEGYRCPHNTGDTVATVSCSYEDSRMWHKCFMRCVSNDL